jgi:dTDP-4-dehydrorhamnose 3,5-epimerase
MIFTETDLKGSFIIDLEPFTDERGWFARTFCKKEFEKISHRAEWVQMNDSFTSKKGTIRGMHFQYPPYSEIKMVRCVAGAVYDVIIDLRHGSESFLQWVGIELSAQNRSMIYIPEGFAHGFQALTDNCELIYYITSYFTPGAEGGIMYNDPGINIRWQTPITIISNRDLQHPLLDDSFTGIKV